MITVYTPDGEHEHEDAVRVSTDEANNLVIYEGKDADLLTRIYAAGAWLEVAIDYGKSRNQP